MKIDEVLDQFNDLKLKVKYLKGNCTGISINAGVTGYDEYTRYDLSSRDIDNTFTNMDALFKMYAKLDNIIQEYSEKQKGYNLDELFTDIQEAGFTINGISIDKHQDKYIYYNLVRKQGESVFLEALKIYQYNRAKWLRQLRLQLEQHNQRLKPYKKKKKFPEKWYALYHAILIATGKEKNFLPTDGKKEKIAKGKKLYGTGEGFYKVFKDIDLTKTYSFVNSLNAKDRKEWKEILTEISNNDVDIISWVKKQPN